MEINLNLSNDYKNIKISNNIKSKPEVPKVIFNKNNFEKELLLEINKYSVVVSSISSTEYNKKNLYTIKYSSSYENSKKILLFILKNNVEIKNIELIETKTINIISTKIIFEQNE